MPNEISKRNVGRLVPLDFGPADSVLYQGSGTNHEISRDRSDPTGQLLVLTTRTRREIPAMPPTRRRDSMADGLVYLTGAFGEDTVAVAREAGAPVQSVWEQSSQRVELKDCSADVQFAVAQQFGLELMPAAPAEESPSRAGSRQLSSRPRSAVLPVATPSPQPFSDPSMLSPALSDYQAAPNYPRRAPDWLHGPFPPIQPAQPPVQAAHPQASTRIASPTQYAVFDFDPGVTMPCEGFDPSWTTPLFWPAAEAAAGRLHVAVASGSGHDAPANELTDDAGGALEERDPKTPRGHHVAAWAKERIFALRDEGKAPRAIAAELGLKTTTVASVCNRPLASKRKNLTPDRKAAILSLRAGGMDVADIADNFGVARSTVWTYLRLAREAAQNPG